MGSILGSKSFRIMINDDKRAEISFIVTEFLVFLWDPGVVNAGAFTASHSKVFKSAEEMEAIELGSRIARPDENR